MADFIRNGWYLAAWAHELPETGALTRRLLDSPWLLWRNPDGTPAMIADRCPHRFVPLSRGTVAAGRVACGYHGLTFDGTGACIHNPFGPVPAGARVAAPPLVERHGGLWFWPGDPAEADPAQIPDFAFIDTGEPVERAVHRMAAPHDLVIDNLMDLSHAEFLHVESFGTNGSLMSHGRQSVVNDETGAIWNNWDIAGAVPPGWATPLLPPGARVDQWLHIRWHAPAAMALFIGMAHAGTDRENPVVPPMANPHILTPETAETTHYFFTHKPGEAEAAQARRVFLEEDEPMIQAQHAAMAGADFWDLRPLVLPSDAAAIRVRRRRMQLLREESIPAA